MLVRNREGRAVKCEGNPDHPINQGRLCARGQAALQGLYDPDRLRGPLHQGRPTTWDEALRFLGDGLRRLRGTGRVAVISDLQTGSLAALIRRWLELFESDRYFIYEPLSYDSIREANRLLYGQPLVPVPSLGKADFILSFGADFLETWLSPVQLTREFAANRSARFVYVGPRVSMTAANADERILVRPGDERHVALAMLRVLLESGVGAKLPVPREALAAHSPEAVEKATDAPAEAIRRLARAFAQAVHPLALAGDPLRPYDHETVLAAGLLTITAGGPGLDVGAAHALSGADSAGRVRAFHADLREAGVEALVLIGNDPVYEIGVRQFPGPAARESQMTIGLVPHATPKVRLPHWALGTHTPLESWGDYEPQSGVLSVQQPAMGPLYDTRSAGDVLLALAQAAGYDLQREFGATTFREYLFGRWAGWGAPDELLQRGGAWERPAPSPLLPSTATKLRFTPPRRDESLRVHVFPHIALFDGRGANRPWLQELPDPMTKVAWSDWMEVHPREAQAEGIAQGSGASLVFDGDMLFCAAAVVHPGLARATVAWPLGYGNDFAGRYAREAGGLPAEILADPALEVHLAAWSPTPVALPCADGSPHQHGRELARVVRGEEPEHEELRLPLPEGYTRDGDMMAGHPHRDHRWAMAVDLNRCTGCGACAVACQAENNIGVVGAEQFAKHRVMSWIRIDRYYDWSDPAAPVLFLPLMCQHCDAAPCEPVCPVFAAAHSEEGLNMQVYNRCIGTRYCANNCPYKVRKFNWLDWEWPEPLNWQANPDVTVRSRGVMEKCTFCIQRIREAEVRARREDRPLRDGDVVPACAQTCPAEALVFGDLMDPTTRIARIVAEDTRAYQLLGELNTKPAVFYLKRVVRPALST
jgi:molybdopterin-containing oxidoreductase family iron-sulfur binding subunit